MIILQSNQSEEKKFCQRNPTTTFFSKKKNHHPTFVWRDSSYRGAREASRHRFTVRVRHLHNRIFLVFLFFRLSIVVVFSLNAFFASKCERLELSRLRYSFPFYPSWKDFPRSLFPRCFFIAFDVLLSNPKPLFSFPSFAKQSRYVFLCEFDTRSSDRSWIRFPSAPA